MQDVILRNQKLFIMARIQLSGFITDIRGSIGGTTFQRTKSGIIAKNKHFCSATLSIARNTRTNQMFYLQQQWKNLSDALRSEWQKYAVYKKIPYRNDSAMYLNGHQYFLKYNSYRIIYGYSIVTNPEWVGIQVGDLTCTFCMGVGGLNILYNRSVSHTDEFVFLKMTTPVIASLNNPGSRLRCVVYTQATGLSQAIATEYINTFGRTAWFGDIIHYQYRVIDLISYSFYPWKSGRVELAACV